MGDPVALLGGIRSPSHRNGIIIFTGIQSPEAGVNNSNNWIFKVLSVMRRALYKPEN